MRISLSEEAQSDAAAAIDWYLGEGAIDAADHLVAEIDRALALLKRLPELGHGGTYGPRTLPLHSFPYSLVYRIVGEEIRIIAVAHHSRRPGFWTGRK